MLMEDVVTPLLEGDVIVIREPIITMDTPALPQQELRQMEPDEAGAAGDECCAVGHSTLDLRLFPDCHSRASKKITRRLRDSLAATDRAIGGQPTRKKRARWRPKWGVLLLPQRVKLYFFSVICIDLRKPDSEQAASRAIKLGISIGG